MGAVSNGTDLANPFLRCLGGDDAGAVRDGWRTGGPESPAPGPFAVGYTSSWGLDWSRAYNRVFPDKTTYASGKAPRPILINMWYPAERSKDLKPMPHRGYLEIQSREPRLSKLSDELIEYEHDVVCKEIMGKPKQELTEEERQLLDLFWDTPTSVHRNARADRTEVAARDLSFRLWVFLRG